MMLRLFGSFYLILASVSIIFLMRILHISGFETGSFPAIKISTATRRFIDDLGRERIFRGVNAVYKIAPWLPSTDRFNATESLSPEDAEILKSWGFNIVRLGVMWPGLEPNERGSYDFRK